MAAVVVRASSTQLATAGSSTPLASSTVEDVEFIGSVGDGPVTGAAIRITSTKGEELGGIVSDNEAKYRVRVRPRRDDYPLHLVAKGGIDLVTGKAPDFQMESVMTRSSRSVVNINPFSTLITLVAKRLPGGLTEENINTAKTLVMDQLSFGLNKSLVRDPVTSRITRTNVAQIVKASEALGEAVRRTRDLIKATGQPSSGDAVMTALAADMTDGHPDGLGSNGIDPTVTAVFNVVTGQVLVESLSNNLRVGGVIATGVIDQAIETTESSVRSSQLTDSVRVTADVLDQASIALAAAQRLDSNPALGNLVNILDGINANATPASVEGVLPANSTILLNTAVNRAARASAAQISAVNTTVFAQGDAGTTPPPVTTPPPSTTPPPTSTANSSFTLRWTAPAARTDGSPLSLSEIDGYRIYYGTGRGNYTRQVVLANGSATSATINNINNGTYFLVMTTYDNNGLESARSGEVTKIAR